MCGIFGGLALQQPFAAETAAALRMLAHRGPDGEGLVDLGRAVLGHRRLSVIDLSHAADQPLWDARGEVAIVFNGEIYNYRELREECRAAGLEFRSASDTEVIVNQYRMHGVRAFDRLNGMYAFCLYDTRNGDAFLVRDPFGIKPLYYAPTQAGVFFSSELQPLLHLAAVDTRIDRTALQAYLQLDFVPGPYSIVRGARKLPGGRLLRVRSDGQFDVERYFVRRPAQLERNPLQQFSTLIDAAVKRHLISDVPVGVFLSGGIDSSIVAESARRMTTEPISAFSVSFQEASFDESRWFTEAASVLGIRHHMRALDPAAMLDLVPVLARTIGEPLADGSIYPTYLLSAFAREHVTVALSGDGADELFAGYPTYFAHRAVRRIPAPFIRLLGRTSRLVHGLAPVRFENLSADFKVKKFVDGLHPDLVTRHVRWMGTFDTDGLSRLLVDHDPEADSEISRLLLEPSLESGGDWLEQLLRTDQRFYLQDGVLVKVDRASMASSLEVRVPFLDREVVAFADALGARAKLHGTTTKALLRAHAARDFPPSISRRPKKGFGAPLGRWFRAELRPLLEDLLSRRRLESHGLFRADYVQQLLADHWSGKKDNRKQIFNLLSFVLWYEHFGARESGARADAA